MFKKKFYYLFLSLLLIGCSVQFENSNSITDDIPYANVDELHELCYEGYIDYKLARKICLLEMQFFLDSVPWSKNAIVSEKPVIIWNKDNTPEYYEFHVLENDIIKGYITCNVSKEKGDILSYVGLSKKEYSKNATRSVIEGINRVYDDFYPNCLIMDSARNVSENNLLTNDEIFYYWIESLTEEDYLESNTTKEELIAYYESEKKAEQENNQKYWEYINSIEEELVLTSDRDIMLGIRDDRGTLITDKKQINSNSSVEYTFIEPYTSTNINNKFNYCVPSVLEFVSKVYGVKSEIDINNIISNEIGNNNVGWASKKWKTIEKLTNNKLTISGSLFHTFNGVNNNITKNKLPVISVRGKRDNSLTVIDEIAHARVVVGTAETTIGKSSTKYYYMWDNGAEKSHHPENMISEIMGVPSDYKTGYYGKFWEKHGIWTYMGQKIVKSN